MKPDKRTDAEKFRSLLSRLARVPKVEVEAQESEYQATQRTRTKKGAQRPVRR